MRGSRFAVVADLPVIRDGEQAGTHRVLEYVGDLVGAVERCNRRMSSSIVMTLVPYRPELEDIFPPLPSSELIEALIANQPRRVVAWINRIRGRIGVN